jgi:hypothetical protein
MIGDDFNRTRDQLNSIRARKTKFVCVNDDMQNPTPDMVAFLQAFYTSFFPRPSQFELPPGRARNPPGVGPRGLAMRRWARRSAAALLALAATSAALYGVATRTAPSDDDDGPVSAPASPAVEGLAATEAAATAHVARRGSNGGRREQKVD